MQNLTDIKSEILRLKCEMYKLEDDADRLDRLSHMRIRPSIYSNSKIYEDDVKLITDARNKRSEARLLKHQIQELENALNEKTRV